MNDTHAHKKRKKQLTEELNRIVPILRDDYGAEKIIAFGSFVHGHIGAWSDLDLAVIKSTNLRFLDRLLEVNRLIGPGVSSDILVYTPNEYRTMCTSSLFVQEEIVKKGSILYEKN